MRSPLPVLAARRGDTELELLLSPPGAHRVDSESLEAGLGVKTVQDKGGRAEKEESRRKGGKNQQPTRNSGQR